MKSIQDDTSKGFAIAVVTIGTMGAGSALAASGWTVRGVMATCGANTYRVLGVFLDAAAAEQGFAVAGAGGTAAGGLVLMAEAEAPGAAQIARGALGAASGSLEGAVEVVVTRANGKIITDIDKVSRGVLWEEKSATGLYGEGAKWIAKHVEAKFTNYLEARMHLPGYENAPIGFKFTDAVVPEFRAAVEASVAALRANNPGVTILLDWAGNQ